MVQLQKYQQTHTQKNTVINHKFDIQKPKTKTQTEITAEIVPFLAVSFASLATLAAAAGFGFVSAGLAAFSTLPLAGFVSAAFGLSAFGFSVFPDFYKQDKNKRKKGKKLLKISVVLVVDMLFLCCMH